MRRMITNKQIEVLSNLLQGYLQLGHQKIVFKASSDGAPIITGYDNDGAYNSLGLFDDAGDPALWLYFDDSEGNVVKFTTSNDIIFGMADANYIQLSENKMELYCEQQEGIDIASELNVELTSNEGNILVEASDGNVSISGNNVTVAVESDGTMSVSGPGDYGMTGSFDEDLDGYLTLIDGENVKIEADGGYIIMSGLPTADPEVEGALWNDNGVLKISAGE